MHLHDLTTRALDIRQKYAVLEGNEYGRAWTTRDIAQGFVGDVGDLIKLVMAKEGIRDIADVDKKLAHELADCLWSILVLAHEYGVDLDTAFFETMDTIDKKISQPKG